MMSHRGPAFQTSAHRFSGAATAVGLVAAAMLFMTLAPAEARADSPVIGNAEVTLGPYYPSIDEEFGDVSPFSDTYGTKNRVLGELKGEYYLFTGHGKLGLGGSAGYTNFSGKSDVGGSQDGSDSDGMGTDGGGNGGDGNGGDGNGGSSSNDPLSLDEETKFQVFPLRASLSYRWDFLVEEFGIPFAPKVEGGLDYWLWRAKDGSGNVAEVDGDRARGATAGWHVSARMEFLLDFISPSTAAAFDVNWGVNNTYLFAEYTYSQIDDFGGDSFRLGGSTWKGGLSFEF